MTRLILAALLLTAEANSDPLLSADPEVALTEATRMMFDMPKPLKESDLDRLHAYTLRDLRMRFPFKVQIDYTADAASIHLNQAKKSRLEMAWTMQQALDYLAKEDPRRDRVAATARKLLSHAQHANRRIRALDALLSHGLATESDILNYIRINTSPTYGGYHIALGRDHRPTLPAAELLVVQELSNPLPMVRSGAIDVMRKWNELRSPLAREVLAKRLPRLSGFSKQVAQSLLKPNTIGGSEDPDAALVSKLLEDDIYEQRQLGQYRPDQPRRTPKKIEWTPKGDTTEIAPISNEQFITSITAADSDHSMPQFRTYLEERLGPAVVQQIENGRVQAVVYAGTEETLMRSNILEHAPGKAVQPIHLMPTPYEQWGIQKYLNTAANPPQLIIRIPPIPAYAKHYDSMLRSIAPHSAQPSRVWINTSDTQKMVREFKGSASKIIQTMDHPPDVIAMGYDYIWNTALANSQDWRVLSSHVIEEPGSLSHLRVRTFDLQLRKYGGKSVRVLVLGSDRVLWGEASSELMGAFLEASPQSKLAIFAGSAGAPGFKHTYTISIPSRFIDRSRKFLPMNNALLTTSSSTHPIMDELEDSKVKLYTHGTHGASVSPAEQTRNFVAKHYTSRGTSDLSIKDYFRNDDHGVLVDTVDVETHLIVSRISEINQKRPKDQRVSFGAMHVITDHPNIPGFTWDVGHSLDAIDREKKTLARRLAVDQTLERLGQWFNPKWICLSRAMATSLGR